MNDIQAFIMREPCPLWSLRNWAMKPTCGELSAWVIKYIIVKKDME
tara:strand:+ start:88 stop:225 length:138 start_codon:yes stop_codon:yes gene_type:complete